MAVSPSASATLYRNRWAGVTLLALAVALAQIAGAQTKVSTKKPKGPRALALVELTPTGAAHLIPVVIMVDGEFYDASAYKAAPVPMALESGTVYEAERMGTSLGLFTVTGALQGPNNTWAGAGTWLPAGSKPAHAAHKAESKPRDLEENDGPPVLRRRGEKPTPAEPAPPPTPAPAASAPTASTPAPATPAPAAPAASAPAAPATAAASTAPPVPAWPPASADEDPDRPVLRRGKPRPSAKKKPTASSTSQTTAPPSAALAAKPAKSMPSGPQMVPAISDAGGPEPHSYAYPMKPDEEPRFRKKILAMAADEITARVKQLASETVGTPAPAHPAARRGSTASAKPPQPSFDDVQLQVIDPSSSNEPILILMAKAQMPAGRNDGPAALPSMITLVARQDIYGDLHKVFSNVTDAQHLDVLPRYDFIDVVDADGDGRGELLFRKVSDAASAFTIYRVIGNQLWPLFDGTLGE
jgi:hypothetical protein